ncbi:MAG: 2-C-methyl-D-erythritol 4-phosphate cytidylyltransferase [Eubacterium sp.]|nr:2-C-methyl-D-erythritol 4-phosphate cytidylyltransferase [Eubacterium sp.]
MEEIKTIAIVMAAGKGSRMKADINKVYMELLGKPVLYYSLKAFERSRIDQVILVVTPGDEDYVKKEIVEAYGLHKAGQIVAGGRERFESVFLGIEACRQEEAYLFIHDGARPFILPEQINTCVEEIRKYKACAVAMPVKDTIRIVDKEGFSLLTPNRNDLWQMQTPQCCLLSEARKAYRLMMESGDKDITDDVMVLERYGNRRSKMIPGSYDNIKLTTPEDMVVAESILKKYLGS